MNVDSHFPASQVNIGVRHVFSAELDEKKRDYILATSNPDHCYGDVKCFRDRKAHCYVCGHEHVIDSDESNIDILAAGPSCKDLSSLTESMYSFYIYTYIYI